MAQFYRHDWSFGPAAAQRIAPLLLTSLGTRAFGELLARIHSPPLKMIGRYSVVPIFPACGRGGGGGGGGNAR